MAEFTHNETILFHALNEKMESQEAPLIAFILETGRVIACNAGARNFLSIGKLDTNAFRIIPEKMNPMPLLTRSESYSSLRIERLCMTLHIGNRLADTIGETLVLRLPAKDVTERLYICSLSEKYTGLQDLLRDTLLDSIWILREMDEPRVARQLLDSLPGMVYWKDPSLRFRGCNASFANRYRRSPNEIIGKLQHEIEPDKIVASHAERVDRDVLETGRRVYNSFEPYAAGGGVEWVRTQRIPIKSENHETVGVLGWIEDVAEQMGNNFENARLKEKVALLESLVSSAALPLVSWVETEKGLETAYVSDSIRCLGVDARVLTKSKPWLELIHPDDRSFIMSEWRRLARARNEFTLNYRIIDDSRMVRSVRAHMRTLRSSSGIVVRYEGALEEL